MHHLNLVLDGYYYQNVENGFYLQGEYVYTYKFKSDFGFDFPIGGVYQHDFYPGEIYEQNTESGTWEKAKQLGKSHALVTFGLGFTYLKPKKLQPFIRSKYNRFSFVYWIYDHKNIFQTRCKY